MLFESGISSLCNCSVHLQGSKAAFQALARAAVALQSEWSTFQYVQVGASVGLQLRWGGGGLVLFCKWVQVSFVLCFLRPAASARARAYGSIRRHVNAVVHKGLQSGRGSDLRELQLWRCFACEGGPDLRGPPFLAPKNNSRMFLAARTDSRHRPAKGGRSQSFHGAPLV